MKKEIIPQKKKKHYNLVSKNHEKVFKDLNYIKHSLILVSTITGCVTVSVLASLNGFPIGITSSTVRLKICTITAGIKKYKSIIRKKRKKHNKIILLAKPMLNSIDVLRL